MKPAAESRTIQFNRATFIVSVAGGILSFALANVGTLDLHPDVLKWVLFVVGMVMAAISAVNVYLRLSTDQGVVGGSTVQTLLKPQQTEYRAPGGGRDPRGRD